MKIFSFSLLFGKDDDDVYFVTYIFSYQILQFLNHIHNIKTKVISLLGIDEFSGFWQSYLGPLVSLIPKSGLNYLPLSIPEEGFSKNPLCEINFLILAFFFLLFFVLYQHVEMAINSSSSPKQQCTSIYVAPLEHIIRLHVK